MAARRGLSQERYAESIEMTMRVLEGRKRVLGREHPAVARTCYNLAVAAEATGDLDAARRWLEEAISVGRVADAGDVVTFALAKLADMSREEGDLASAKAGYLEAAAARRAFGIDDLSVALWLHEAGRCASKLEEHDEAVRLNEQALALRRELAGEDANSTLKSRVALTRSLQAAGRFEEAEELAHEIHERLLAQEGEGSSLVGSARQLLAELYDAWGRPDEAARWR